MLVAVKLRRLAQRFACCRDASPCRGPRSFICANATHDEPAPALARKRISLLPFRAFLHSRLPAVVFMGFLTFGQDRAAARPPVCTENLIRVDDVVESPKLAE
jgi:hypothetical protein